MLNIISLTANRRKTTGPWKVVKNLMKWLDQIGYPYVLNADLNATKMLWIHDDFFVLKKLHTLHKDIHIILGPNLYALPRLFPKNISIWHYPHIVPAKWGEDFWRYFGYKWILDIWAVGIDTDLFYPSDKQKTKVLIYFKHRKEEDLMRVIGILDECNIDYKIMRYGEYSEQKFSTALEEVKYVIWVGCPESQGIAFAEVLSSGIPILVWDVKSLWDCYASHEVFTQAELEYNPVTSAPYFDTSCGISIVDHRELYSSIKKMELSFQDFKPRAYIENNFSLAWQARKFINLYEAHFHLSFEEWIKEVSLSKKKFRNNFILTALFVIYDSPFSLWIRKIFLK